MAKRQTIDEMAYDYHVVSNSLDFDKAWAIKIDMMGRFGSHRTNAAIVEVQRTLKILGIDK